MSRPSPTPVPTLNPSPPPVCVGATVLLYQCQGLPAPQSKPEPPPQCVWVLQCCFINVKAFPHPSPHPNQCVWVLQSSAALSMSRPSRPLVPTLNPSPPSVCGCYSAALSMSRPSRPLVPTLNPSPPPVCVGATVLLYQCQGLPAPQSPP